MMMMMMNTAVGYSNSIHHYLLDVSLHAPRADGWTAAAPADRSTNGIHRRCLEAERAAAAADLAAEAVAAGGCTWREVGGREGVGHHGCIQKAAPLDVINVIGVIVAAGGVSYSIGVVCRRKSDRVTKDSVHPMPRSKRPTELHQATSISDLLSHRCDTIVSHAITVDIV